MNTEMDYTDQSLEDWILIVTQRARSEHPMVSERVHTTLEQLLKEQLSDRKLTPANLRKFAAKLLAEQASQQPETEEKQ